MTYDQEAYEAGRKRANDRSREHAKRSGEPWNVLDDSVLMERWVRIRASDRDELAIAMALSRTIEACRIRAHLIAGINMGLRYAAKVEASTPKRFSWMDDWEAETGGRCEL